MFEYCELSFNTISIDSSPMILHRTICLIKLRIFGHILDILIELSLHKTEQKLIKLLERQLLPIVDKLNELIATRVLLFFLLLLDQSFLLVCEMFTKHVIKYIRLFQRVAVLERCNLILLKELIGLQYVSDKLAASDVLFLI